MNYINFDIIYYFTLYKYLLLSLIIFFVGIIGVFVVRRNIIIIIMSIELLFLSINMFFLFLSIYMNDILGQMFSLYILTVVAAESSIGLALLVIYYRLRGTIAVDYISSIKG